MPGFLLLLIVSVLFVLSEEHHTKLRALLAKKQKILNCCCVFLDGMNGLRVQPKHLSLLCAGTPELRSSPASLGPMVCTVTPVPCLARRIAYRTYSTYLAHVIFIDVDGWVRYTPSALN